ncbi:glycosyltransferase [Desulfobulbus alkaliphilus]|uniref:glycosyltransferase n=1 Tax=Desulfobulbus alkaliphilus TaxID=869814 RepID=UPI0019646595|nr:glycosyltransferase [Desulfobulbus alkaliphilus]MBM9538562.1 glycosyltransferase [Desulfobulbus alkaliphilus]
MRIAYLNARYNETATSGGNAHIGQFISQCVALGHEIWMESGSVHELINYLPSGRIALLKALRSMDAIYIRIEWFPPPQARWALPPYRFLFRSTLMVWEFNTVPEYGFDLGRSAQEVESAIDAFKKYGQGCDLAVCVSAGLTEYVQQQLYLKNVLTVPNGSDPDLFRPDRQPVKRIQSTKDQLKVVWIGSANLPWHNLEMLRMAADWLWSNGYHDDISFHIIGKGLVNLNEMTPNIYYHGQVAYVDLPNWLSGMDVGLVLYKDGPSMYGSPLKMFDYYASGLPVVGVYQPQFSELLEELGQNGLLVPDGDFEALAKILLQLAQDRSKLKSFGLAGRNLIIHKYNWRMLVSLICHEINALAKGRFVK